MSEWDKELVKDCPNLYRQRYGDMRQTAMCWGFDIEPGWRDLVRDLSLKLEKLIVDTIPDVDEWSTVDYRSLFETVEEMEVSAARWGIRNNPTWNEETLSYKRNDNKRHLYCASQVKSKYAGLRFYMHASTEEMDKLIEQAETLSSTICETCGAPGTVQRGGWLYVACEEHINA